MLPPSPSISPNWLPSHESPSKSSLYLLCSKLEYGKDIPSMEGLGHFVVASSEPFISCSHYNDGPLTLQSAGFRLYNGVT